MRQAPEVRESLRQVAAVESSESTNHLEGVVAPRKRRPRQRAHRPARITGSLTAEVVEHERLDGLLRSYQRLVA